MFTALLRRPFISLCVLAFAAWGGGCASTGLPTTGRAAVAHDAATLRGLPAFRGDGTPARFEEIVAAAVTADVVMLGENHGHPVGLAWAAMLFEEVLTGAPRAALSMEFFERDDQTRLDDYLNGLTDEAAFRKRADRTQGNYPEGHRRMVEAAKAAGRPVVAANTTWEVVRFLRGKDYDALRALTPEQQRLFCIPAAPPEGRYRADFDAVMGEMIGPTPGPSGGVTETGESTQSAITPEKQATLDARFRTQHLWDWTMGESITRAADAGSRPVFHVIGRFHSDFGGGTPQAVAKIRPGTSIVLVSVVDADSTRLRDEDRGRADFVVYVGPSRD